MGESGGRSLIGKLALMGGRITANGTLAGIGSGGEGGEVQSLIFAGSRLSIRCAANGTNFPVNASSILFSNASVIFETPGDRLFGVSPGKTGRLNLAVLFGAATSHLSEPLSNLSTPLLQVGRLSSALSGDLTLCVTADSGDPREHCFEIQSPSLRSLIVTVGFPGLCSVTLSNATASGFLESSEGLSSFEVASDPFFISEGHFVFAPRPTPTPTPTEVFTPPLRFPFHSRRMLILRFGWFFLWRLAPLQE
jgi:hypothetical protein